MSGLGAYKAISIPDRGIIFRVYDTLDHSPNEHLLILMHGCGFTSQTFGAMVASFPRSVRVIAFDSRGHGGTVCDDMEGEKDLSIETLVADAKCLLESVCKESDTFVLCGHSMGGVRVIVLLRCPMI